MVQRKDSYIPEFYTEYRYDKPMLFNRSMEEIKVSGLEHIVDRRTDVERLSIHDIDCVAILKDMIRRAEKNE